MLLRIWPLSADCPNISQTNQSPTKLEEVDVVEGMEMEGVEAAMEMEDEEEDVEQMPKPMLTTPTNPL